MSEKKNSKMGILIVFLILIIVGMGIYIYMLNKDKSTQNANSTVTNSQINNVSNSTNRVQENTNTNINTNANTSNDPGVKENVNTNANTNTKNNANSTTVNNVTNNSQNSNENSAVSHIILEVEVEGAQEIEFKEKKITDKQKIDSFMKIVNSAVPYNANNGAPDIGDVSYATIYFTNGEKYKIAAHDKVENAANDANIMYKWYRDDASDKVSYKLNTKLEEDIKKLFNE